MRLISANLRGVHMLKRVSLTVLLMLSSLAGIAHAVPIRYAMDFDGAVAGPAGTGEFLWDPGTLTMTGLSWQFEGDRGFVNDEDLAASVGSYTLGLFLYDVLVKPGEIDPLIGGIPAITSFLSIDGGFPQPFARFMIINRRCYPAELTSGPFYFFTSVPSGNCTDAPYKGIVTTHAVAEPDSLALLALGVGAFLMRVRRRHTVAPSFGA